MRYKVIIGFMTDILDTLNRKAFEKEVQSYIDEGWEPRGGVGMTTDKNNDICLSQVLVQK